MRYDVMLMGAFSAVLLLSGIVTAWPDEVPVLDLGPICNGIVKAWRKYTPGDRQRCVAETTMGGSASYTNLIGCLESAKEAHTMFPGRNRPYRIEQ
jgi:hypothetical protein